MRVPTYQSQTELTGSVPGQRFTVSANPGALSQTAKAFSGLGAQIQKEGTDFYSRLLGEQRDTELKQAQMDYKKEQFSSTFIFKNPNETERCGCGESFKA